MSRLERFVDRVTDESMMEDFDRWVIPIITLGLVLATGVILGYALALIAHN